MPGCLVDEVRNRTSRDGEMVRFRTSVKLRGVRNHTSDLPKCEIAPEKIHGAKSHHRVVVVRNRTMQTGKHINEVSILPCCSAKSHVGLVMVRNRTLKTARFSAISHRKTSAISPLFC
jgi:hypothetical protein